MQIAHIIASNIVATDADALVTLDYEARFIRRKVLKTDAGESFLVELPGNKVAGGNRWLCAG